MIEENQENTQVNTNSSGNETSPNLMNKENMPNLLPDDELIDMSSDFDFENYQVVRREFFAHQREPSITFNECKLYVNAACLIRFPQHTAAQVLINRKKQILVLRPCNEGERDSFIWCNDSNGKRKAKAITCKLFYAKLFSLMNWNPTFRYKLLGKLIHANGEYLIVFDLTATEVYQKTFVEGQKPKSSRTPVYPSNWQNQFGVPFYEHQQAMQVNIFDGYAVYSIKEIKDNQQLSINEVTQNEEGNTNS